MGAGDGIVFRIKKYAIHDGPGIRTTIFLKGCPLACWWCHNPEGRNTEPQIIAPARGRDPSDSTTPPETIGRRMTVDHVMAQIVNDLIFYDESGGGATFSGGEPLMQPGFLADLLDRCRKEQVHTAVDTSGYAPADIFSGIAARADLLLFDLKLMDDAAHRAYTGVSNRPILENLEMAAHGGRPLRIRFPVIPGITDGEDNLRRVADFLDALDRVRNIDLLPFHRIADGKYGRLGLENRMKTTPPPSRDILARIAALFRGRGFSVSVGGTP
jgi:pyruvate formate lyase activating enzyme